MGEGSEGGEGALEERMIRPRGGNRVSGDAPRHTNERGRRVGVRS
jgi:hypothetical protein